MAFALLKPSRHDVYEFINPEKNLKNAAAGKTVLVTGAGGGIGRGIAEAFALAGAEHLIIAARRTEPLEETKSKISQLAPHCNVIVAGGTDITNEASIDRALGMVSSPPDVLVSNAAISGALTPLIDSDPDTWWESYDVNLRGTYLIARAYLRAVRAAKKDHGIIINVSSNNSWRYIPGLSSYGASKIGINTMSEYIDREEQDSGGAVRCVAMHPGGVLTDMARAAPQWIKDMLIDQPALPGATAVYLSTSRAEFLMGRFINATWDMEELEKLRKRVVKEDLLMSRVVGVA